ncbi:MAG: ECF transporter S component [Oscillospiraceae bacterium]|nr:ECF transporter S component [Oscillospiraceae bacterium]
MARLTAPDRTRTIAVTGMLLAVLLLFVFTPIGYIPIPPANPTTMCIPVLVGMMVEGLPVGMLLGFAFGLTSLLRALFGVSLYVFSNPLISIIPRVLIPVTSWLILNALGSLTRRGALGEAAAMGISAFCGSATNTLLVLPLITLFYGDALGKPIGVLMLTNGLPEAITAAILVPAVVAALQRAGLRRLDPTQSIVNTLKTKLTPKARHNA